MLPFNDYFEYFGPDYKLHLPVSNMENLNTPKYLEGVLMEVKLAVIVAIFVNNMNFFVYFKVLQILSEVEAAPSVPIFSGQIGTTIIPDSISTATATATASVAMEVEGPKGADVRPDEVGNRPVSALEYYEVR